MPSELNVDKLHKQPTRKAQCSKQVTDQGQLIRNSHCPLSCFRTNNQGKSKPALRVMTQHFERIRSVDKEMKKIMKQFGVVGSPKGKGRMLHSGSKGDAITKSNKKTHRVNQSLKIGVQVEGVKKKKMYLQHKTNKEKPYLKHGEKSIHIKSHFHDNQNRSFAPNTSSKMLHSQSINFLNNVRLKTSGSELQNSQTFDSTPPQLTINDILIEQVIGQGTFGKVYKGRLKSTGEIIAIKRVYQDAKYKNREVEIVSMLASPFTMKVLATFSNIEAGQEYLNIVMESYDTDLFRFIQNCSEGLSVFEIKLISYQMFRGLMYLHSKSIAHRDIKPHNILMKGKKVVLCDFGSAKILSKQPNLPYICSRCYRAPELIFGAVHYSTAVDIWSAGCVMLEMINGMPLFIGQTSIDHLIEVIKVIGTPTKTQVIEMNPKYDLNDYKFPKIKRKQWSQIFPKSDPQLLDLLSKIMIYSPKQRYTAAQVLCHSFYDQLRDELTSHTLQQMYQLDLLTFTDNQLRNNKDKKHLLMPEWCNNN